MRGLVQPGAIARRDWLRLCLGGLGAGGLGAGGLAVGVLSAGAGRPARAEAPAAAVSIDNFAFNPATIRIKPGTTVTWTNRDDIPHVVLFSVLKLRSKVMDTDQTFSQLFDAPGSFDYFCALHPHMKGKVIVAL